jgi:hypothetical protein
MLRLTLNGNMIMCNKCGRIIRSNVVAMSESAVKRYQSKKCYCEKCIERRKAKGEKR